MKQQLEETQEQLHQLEETYERLRKRLDQKDEQIHQLKDELEAERKKREIKLESAGSIAEAALKLNGFFGVAPIEAAPIEPAKAPPRTEIPMETALPEIEIRRTEALLQETETAPGPAAPRKGAGRSNSAKVVARMARARRAGR